MKGTDLLERAGRYDWTRQVNLEVRVVVKQQARGVQRGGSSRSSTCRRAKQRNHWLRTGLLENAEGQVRISKESGHGGRHLLAQDCEW